MRRRSTILFVLINILVSLGVAFVVVSVLNQNQRSSQQPIVITVPIVMTATGQTAATPNVIVITATLPDGVVQLPTGIVNEVLSGGTRQPVPTLDETFISESGVGEAVQGTGTALPSNCVPYVVQEGDFPSSIAEQYSISYLDLMAVNGLTEETAANLQIGQVLIVPLEGCTLTAESLSATETATFLPSPTPTVPSPTPSDTPTPSRTPAVSNTPVPPTATRTSAATSTSAATAVPTTPPTAASAQVQIANILAPGDITGEGVQIRNISNATVDVSGWTLRDGDGNSYTFPADRRLFGGGTLIVFTRSGDDTPVALYWDEAAALWSSGESAILSNSSGQAQSVFEVP